MIVGSMMTHGAARVAALGIGHSTAYLVGVVVLSIGCRRRTGRSIVPPPPPDRGRDRDRRGGRGLGRDASARSDRSHRDRRVPRVRRSRRDRRLRLGDSALVARARRKRRPHLMLRRSAVAVVLAPALAMLLLLGRHRQRRGGGRRHHADDRDDHDAAGSRDDASRGSARARDLDADDLLGGSRPGAAAEPGETVRAERGRRLDRPRRAAAPDARGGVPHHRRRYPIGRRVARPTARASRCRSRSGRARRARRWRAATALPRARFRQRVSVASRSTRSWPRTRGKLFDAKQGLLGDTLAAAGVSRAVIGNADASLTPEAAPPGTPAGETGYRRFAPLALTGENGIVPAGEVASSLLTNGSRPRRSGCDSIPIACSPRSTAPGTKAPRSGRVVLVEASDLLRLQAYAPLVASERARGHAAAGAAPTSTPGRAAAAAGDPAHDAVLVVVAVAAARARSPDRRELARARRAARARGSRTGRATPGLVYDRRHRPDDPRSTRLEPPRRWRAADARSGARGGDFADRVNWMVDTNKAAQFRDREIAPVTVWFVVLQILLTLAALVAFVKLGRRALIAIELAALDAARFPRRDVPRRPRFPSTTLGAAPYWLFLFGVGCADRADRVVHDRPIGRHDADRRAEHPRRADPHRRRDRRAACSSTRSSAYSPTVAGSLRRARQPRVRAVLAAGGVLLAGLLADRIGGRRGALVAIALLGVAIVVDGAPFFGSDVGGVLSMVPAYAVTATLLLGWQRAVASSSRCTARRRVAADRDLRGHRLEPARRQADAPRAPGRVGRGRRRLAQRLDDDPAQARAEHRRVLELDVVDHVPARARRHRVPHLPRAGSHARPARAPPAAVGGAGRARGPDRARYRC